tara:strand:+ start:9928 stop:10812 length:885 start_codon:yes stop_codon:yes gene_type:complete
MNLIEAYRKMFLIRTVEEEIVTRYMRDLKMRTPTHLSIGQESIPVGVLMALPEDTHVFASHRCHAAYLAHGCDLDAMIAELHGKATGCTGGKGGSMHLWSEDPFFMAHPIVGDSISLAVGSAFAAKLEGSNRATAVFFGDGASESGQLWEAMNFAALHQLRLLFVCENNGYASQTPLSQRQPNTSLATRTNGIVKSFELGGDDISGIERHSRYFRNADGPLLLEIPTSRWKEHCGPLDDWDLGYRSKDKLGPDPLEEMDGILTPQQERSIRDKVIQAFERAEAALWPEVEYALP